MHNLNECPSIHDLTLGHFYLLTTCFWIEPKLARLHLYSIYYYVCSLPIVEANEAFDACTFVGWIKIVPDGICTLISVDCEVEIPVQLN